MSIYITGEVLLEPSDHTLLSAMVWLINERLKPAKDDYIDIRIDDADDLIGEIHGERFTTVEEVSAEADFRENELKFVAKLTEIHLRGGWTEEGVIVEVKGKLNEEPFSEEYKEGKRKARNFIGRRYTIQGSSAKEFRIRKVERLERGKRP